MEDANGTPISPPPPTSAAANNSAELTTLSNNNFSERNPDISDGIKDDPAEAAASEELSSSDTSVYGTPQALEDDHADEEEEEEEELDPSPKKQKTLANSPKIEPTEHGMTELPSPSNAIPDPPQNGKPPATKSGKKSKKKSKDVWTTTSRKGKKKTKHASNSHNSKKSTNGGDGDEKVLIIPAPRFPSDDSPDLQISLSKIYKAEKVELSNDRLTAGSTKGYRMVRATRGVTEGAWYYEIKVVHLGDTGHTRLGWSTDKGDLQAPVGYDGNSFGYRDVDGSKVHKALREKYGEEGYKEGDVIGFFINLPDGEAYAPNPPRLVWYKGQRYVCPPDAKEDPPKVVPGSEISFFKNGICQGVAYRDIYGGHYYPAASMYTLPNQQNCVVKFNFGPDFEIFPKEFSGRPLPRPMIEVPYQDYESKVEIGSPRNITRMCPMFKECGSQIGKAAEMIGSA